MNRLNETMKQLLYDMYHAESGSDFPTSQTWFKSEREAVDELGRRGLVERYLGGLYYRLTPAGEKVAKRLPKSKYGGVLE